jgi:hypothetical protein
VVELLLRFGADVAAREAGGNTAFHLACRWLAQKAFDRADAGAVRALLGAGCDPGARNGRDDSGADLLMGASRAGRQWLALLDSIGRGKPELEPEPEPELEPEQKPEPEQEPEMPAAQAEPRPAAGLAVFISHRVDDSAAFVRELRQALSADRAVGRFVEVSLEQVSAV